MSSWRTSFFFAYSRISFGLISYSLDAACTICSITNRGGWGQHADDTMTTIPRSDRVKLYMTVTISLDAEMEKALMARAQERGLSIDEFLQEIAEREAALATLLVPNSEDKVRSFLAWADSFP